MGQLLKARAERSAKLRSQSLPPIRDVAGGVSAHIAEHLPDARRDAVQEFHELDEFECAIAIQIDISHNLGKLVVENLDATATMRYVVNDESSTSMQNCTA